MSALVTIAIPTLNRAAYFRMALESALAQTYAEIQVVVSDNASTDDTPSVIASFQHDARVLALRQETKLSMVDNWNACVAAATGRYFLMLSDDDLLEPTAIASLVAAFESASLPAEQVGVAYCRGRVIDEYGKVLRVGPQSPAHEPAQDMIFGFFQGRRLTWACTLLFRHADITAGYTDALPLATDAAQWMQAVVRHGNSVFVDEVLASYRVHQNITATTPVAMWQKDNSRLADMAMAWLREQGRLTDSRAIEIRQAVQRLNIGLVPDVINQRFRRHKIKGLFAYGRHWTHFMSASGLVFAAKGLINLLVPGVVSRLKKS